MTKIKLFHFVSNIVGGGAQTQLLLLVKNISHKTFKNYIVYSNAPADFNFKDYPNVSFIKDVDFKRLEAEYLSSNFIIHIWIPNVFTYFSPLKFLKYRKFVVIGIRNKYHLDSFKRIYQLFIFLFFKNFASNTPFLIHSHVYKLVYRKERYKFIPNAIKYKISDNDFTNKIKEFLFVGRIVKQKGVKELVSAFNNFNKDKPSLTVVGSGALEKELIELGGDNISFLGYLTDPQKEFLKHKFFILPSYYEGMPNVAFEALSNNCLLLLSDIPQHKFWFTEDQAIYFKTGSVNSLVKAIEKALSLSKTERESIIITAKETLYNLTLKNFLAEYDSYYKLILDENK
jgi:glycosyltransferase involved in cell wall biosynthesis